MREQVDPDFLVNLVSMLRADVDGALWLVDDEQEAVFYQRCADQRARVVAAPNVAFQILEQVQRRGVEGVIATLRGPEVPERVRGDVFRPSTGDVASLLLISESCASVIEDVCGIPWLTATEKQVGPIHQRTVWIARWLRQLQQDCIDEGAGAVDLRNLAQVIRWDVFEINWDLLQVSLADGGVPDRVLQDVRAGAARESEFAADIAHCDGNDALRVLAAATRHFRPRGLSARRIVEAAELFGMFRVAFHLDEFETDEMFWRMKQWAWRNSRYPLFRQWRTLDPLGAAWDQRYWDKDLLSMLRLVGPEGHLAVFKMDLDNFKDVNDTLGHTTGDEAIRFYCSIIRKLMEGNGEVYRRGGDETVALAPELDPTQAHALAEEIRATVESEFQVWGAGRGLAAFPTASVGLVLTNGGRPIEEIVQLMDTAQRRAKEEGKNRVVCLP